MSTFLTLLRGVPFDEDEDPNAAPTAAGKWAARPARPYTPRRSVQNMVWMYAMGLVFLPFALSGVVARSGTDLAVAVAIVVAISLCFVGSAVAADAGLAARLGYVLLQLGLIVSAATYAGWYFTGFGVYLSIMIAALLPWRFSRWCLLAWNAFIFGAAITMMLAPGILTVPLIGTVVGYSMALGIESGRLRRRLNQALDRAEQRVSTLAVAAERERIGRDLHDLLGHSLTAVSVKAGLAAKLAERDPAAAGAQMREVEQIAREALSDVRATASGLQEVRLTGELASARSVLLAAGIEAQTPSAVPALSEEQSQLFGYVVREAVTNVVRHAEATRCSITVDETSLAIADDGIGADQSGSGPARAGSSGLGGLRRRIHDAGGRLIVEIGDTCGTTVRIVLDSAAGSSPPEAAGTAAAAVGKPAGSPAPLDDDATAQPGSCGASHTGATTDREPSVEKTGSAP